MDNPRMNVKAKNVEPTDKVIRRLFKEPSIVEREEETIAQEQEMYRQNEKRKVEYNFDFVNNKPLQHPDSRFSCWEMVTSQNNANNRPVTTISKLPR